MLSKIWFDIQNLRYFLSDCPTQLFYDFLSPWFKLVTMCGIFHASWRPLEQYWSNLGRSETKKIQGRLFHHQFSARGVETGVVAGRERGPALHSHPSKGRKKVSEIFNEIRLGRWMVSVFMDYPQQDAKDFPHRMKLFSKVLNFMLNLIFRRIGPSRHFSKNFFGLPIT